jgi:hypothetical protein
MLFLVVQMMPFSGWKIFEDLRNALWRNIESDLLTRINEISLG